METAQAMLGRQELGQWITDRLRKDAKTLRSAWDQAAPVKHCIIDDLLPIAVAERIFSAFPPAEVLLSRSSLRERKRVGVELDLYDPIIGEILFAFQEQAVVDAIAAATGITGMIGDPTLYASGVSAMSEGDFLNPHLDNSHDGDQSRYRVLNLLYYATPGWKLANGGNLELWDASIKQNLTVEARFNRLVLMTTDQQSWHSVSRVAVPARRTCISNYYFASQSPSGKNYKHVTTFTGRPDERWKRIVLGVVDGLVLNTIGRLFPVLLRQTKHRRSPSRSMDESASTEEKNR